MNPVHVETRLVTIMIARYAIKTWANSQFCSNGEIKIIHPSALVFVADIEFEHGGPESGWWILDVGLSILMRRLAEIDEEITGH